jgi:hypothetical protein
VRRRTEALDTAFSRRDFDAVRRIAAMLGKLSGKTRIKRIVAGLPEPLRSAVAGMLLGRPLCTTSA